MCAVDLFSNLFYFSCVNDKYDIVDSDTRLCDVSGENLRKRGKDLISEQEAVVEWYFGLQGQSAVATKMFYI